MIQNNTIHQNTTNDENTATIHPSLLLLRLSQQTFLRLEGVRPPRPAVQQDQDEDDLKIVDLGWSWLWEVAGRAVSRAGGADAGPDHHHCHQHEHDGHDDDDSDDGYDDGVQEKE